jgi:hypothetical protein
MANRRKALSQKELNEIESLAGLGLRFEDIAQIKEMSDDTLKKYAGAQLSRGKAKAKAAVSQTAYRMAVSGKYPAMTMFWLKTQAGWRENRTHEIWHDGPDASNLSKSVHETGKPTQIISAFLSDIIDQVRQGHLNPRAASAMAGLIRVLLKSMEQGDLEERLAMVESAVSHPPREGPALMDLSLEEETIQFTESIKKIGES